jgi:hypothetical protein
METKVRAHIVLSKKVIDQIDELVGQRKRSEYIEEKLGEAVQRDRLARAMEAVRNTKPVPGAPPEWDTPEGAAKWVHDSRYTKSARERRIEAMRHEPDD